MWEGTPVPMHCSQVSRELCKCSLVPSHPRHRTRDPQGCDVCTVGSGDQEMPGPAGAQSQLIDSEQEVDTTLHLFRSRQTLQPRTWQWAPHSIIHVILDLEGSSPISGLCNLAGARDIEGS